MNRPDFPPLPPSPTPWPQATTQAYDDIKGAYDRAADVLAQDAPDPLRLQFHSSHILQHVIPIVQALVEEVDNDPWTLEIGNAFGAMVADLKRTWGIASRRERSQLYFFSPVMVMHTGQRGRPRKIIDRDWLADAVSHHRNISLQTLSEHLKIDRKTLRSALQYHGLYHRFAELSDEQLDDITREFKQDKPASGLRYLIGHLRRRGIKIQKDRVRGSLRRVDALGQALRRRQRITHREYISPRPNAKWHLDGHHKLILWGIVIHGFIDGYDRVCTGIHANSNNKSTTVLEVFLEAVRKHGVPSRIRGDRGGENVKVSVWMIKHHGPKRGSFTWGLSTRNTPIERFWVEVGSQVVRPWRAFLARLERLHKLDVENQHHLWLIHYLFLDCINDDLAIFQEEWNLHPMSTRQDLSPEDARFLGRTREGMYADDVHRVHPDLLAQYPNLSGIELDTQLEADQQPEIRHDAIETPRAVAPFQTEIGQQCFQNILRDAAEANLIPVGFGVAPEEWGQDDYSQLEKLKVGKKTVLIKLPGEIWWVRAVKWAQALDTTMQLQELGYE